MIDPRAYDDNGAAVPAVEADIYFDDPPPPESGTLFDAGMLLEVLLTGAKDAEAVGQRAIILAYILKNCRAPRSLRGLGDWLDCSHVTAKARLATFKARFIEQMRFSLTKPPHL